MDLAEVIKELAADTMAAEGSVQVTMGEVIQSPPLKVRTDSGLELDTCFLMLTRNVCSRSQKGNMTFHGESGAYEATVENGLMVGEKVLMLSGCGAQHYFILDRIENM